MNVYKDGQHIENSPFKINVTRNEVGSADKVKVYGDGLTSGVANEVNEFYVDTKDAGRLMDRIQFVIDLYYNNNSLLICTLTTIYYLPALLLMFKDDK